MRIVVFALIKIFFTVQRTLISTFHYEVPWVIPQFPRPPRRLGDWDSWWKVVQFHCFDHRKNSAFAVFHFFVKLDCYVHYCSDLNDFSGWPKDCWECWEFVRKTNLCFWYSVCDRYVVNYPLLCDWETCFGAWKKWILLVSGVDYFFFTKAEYIKAKVRLKHTGAKILNLSENSHLENLIYDKFKFSFFSKFAISKTHFW